MLDRSPLSAAPHAGRSRGFTLVELMVVVSIIAILAVLAIPTMSRAQLDRRVYTDAGYVSELFRMARTRAAGRGGAVLVIMNAQTTNGAGRFEMWEAVSANPTGAGANEVPVSACKSPTVWPGNGTPNANFVDAVDMNNGIEKQAVIGAQVNGPGGAVAPGTTAYACFTPGGRVYYATGTPVFTTPLGSAISVDFRRWSGTFDSAHAIGLTRTVVITPNGTTRIASQ